MGLYGKVTPELMGRILDACGKGGKPWARLLVYLTDKITEGGRLGEVESGWLSVWMRGEGISDPNSILTVQISRAQVSRELFDGQSQTTARAIEKLAELGILKLIRKGRKGHGSLYLVGLVGVTEPCENVTGSYPQKVTKTQGNVTASMEELGHVSGEWGHVFEEYSHIRGAATCGNADTFIDYSETYSKKGGELESGKVNKKCHRCGGEARPFGAYLLDCPKCGAVKDIASEERAKASAQIDRIKRGGDTSMPLRPFISARTGEQTGYC